ncbi:MAG: Nif3-like dinuclear metal center hexameric protein [Bacteroidaceae bacterium]|nr:Nif3-like dinuclear metal center hexameric protein [Prevotellaceae bacterium]
MKIKDILGALEEFAPLALQDGYDNAGLQIGLAEDAEATGVLLSLDVTEEVVNEAVLRGCNLIVSHHPLMFHPVKTFNGKTHVERTILKAIKNDVAVYAAHTNLDVAYGGVNFKIAEKLCLQNVEWLSERESYVSGGKTLMAGDGIIASLPSSVSKKEFMEQVKEVFRLKSLRVNNASPKTIKRVALCGGSGASLIPQAIEKGADVFITGEIGYHHFFGYENDILLLEIGHYESEQYTIEVLRDVISKFAPSLHICKAETNINPIKYL